MAKTVVNSLTTAGLTNFTVLSLKCDDRSGCINDFNVLDAAIYLTAFKRTHPKDNFVAEWSFYGPGNDMAIDMAVNTLNRAGIPIAVSAGNDGVNIDTYPTFPASIRSTNLVAVADTGSDSTLMDFSNYGPKTVPLAVMAGELGTSGSAAIAASWMAVEETSRPMTRRDNPRQGVPRTPYLTAWANSGKSGRERALRLMAIRQARLGPLASSASGRE